MIKELILDILFPKYCFGCGKEGLYICKECELFMTDVQHSVLHNLVAFWEYSGIVKELIHRIKFNGEYDIIKELINKKDFEVAENAVITYVPMHIKKQRKRGFNQAEIIARELGRKTGKPVVKLLEKIKETKDQATLDKAARLENVKNTFRFCGSPGLPQISEVLLVDDVYTSGATMQECSKVLRKAGFKNIWGFTLAKTM